jgi:hypothetical protein
MAKDHKTKAIFYGLIIIASTCLLTSGENSEPNNRVILPGL